MSTCSSLQSGAVTTGACLFGWLIISEIGNRVRLERISNQQETVTRESEGDRYFDDFTG